MRSSHTNVPAQAPPGFRDYALLILLGAIWGASFLLIELALEGLKPLVVATVRVILAAVVLLAVTLFRPTRFPPRPTTWLLIAGIGVINVAIPFFLISWGQQTVDPGQAAILMATAPLMVAMLSILPVNGERITIRIAIGLGCGFLAVVVLLAPAAGDPFGGSLPGQIAILAAALCYALSALLIAGVREHDPLAVGVILFGATATLMLPLSIATVEPWIARPEPMAIAAVVFLGVVSTALAFYLRIILILRQGPVFLAQVGYQIPLFGVLWSWVGLGQAPTARALVALLMLVAGMWIARRRATSSGVQGHGSLR